MKTVYVPLSICYFGSACRRVTTPHDSADWYGCYRRVHLVHQDGTATQAGLGKHGCLVDPLALNQVNMRLPHDVIPKRCGIGAWLI